MAWQILAGAAIGAVGSIIGGNKAADAAEDQADLQNQATQRQYDYNVEAWNFEKDIIDANHAQAVKVIEAKATNEQNAALWKDKTNAASFLYDLQIRNKKQESLNQQYVKSHQLYGLQNTLNYRSAEAAQESEIRKLREIEKEATFDNQQKDIDRLLAEGKIRARGQEGRSVGKTYQATAADHGRQAAMLAESLMGARRDTRAILKEIARDKKAADLAAFAKKMLHPGELPVPIEPYKTPLTEWVLPREIEEFDYGPAPVLGAMRSPSAAANMVWGNTIAGVASSIGGAIGSTSNEFWGG